MSSNFTQIGQDFLFKDQAIKLKINGLDYNNVESLKVDRSMETMAGKFEAQLSIDVFDNFDIDIQDTVQVLIHDTPVLTGNIEKIRRSYSSSSDSISIAARDKTMDAIDSSIVKSVVYKPKAHLRDIIFNLLNTNGIPAKNIFNSQREQSEKDNFIGIIDLAEPAVFDSDDIIKPESGENMFDFIKKYAAKRQVLITTDGFGNIVITRGASNVLDAHLIHRHTSLDSSVSDVVKSSILPPQFQNNNILSASIDKDYTQRFNRYIVKTQGNLNALAAQLAKINAKDVVSKKDEAFDSDVRSSRTLIIGNDDSDSTKTAKSRATWEANIRRTQSLNYNCTVQGFKINVNSKEIWAPNNLVRVSDEKCDVFSLLLIKSVGYEYSVETGSTTTMELGFKDSFQLEAEETVRDLRTNKFGQNI